MDEVKKRPPIALTCGDPAGVGPEIIERWLHEHPDFRSEVVLLGPSAWCQQLARLYAVQCLAVGDVDFSGLPGQPSVAGASIAFSAMEEAAQGCLLGRFRGVVTGPVSKHWLKQIGYEWPGQTEYFASAWGGEPSMAFVGQRLKVVLATWHLPLRAVSDALDADCLEKAVLRANELGRRLGYEQPRIGVCGLNPHAGEGGILGLEEVQILNPCLDRLRANIPGLSTCLPGDTVFHRQIQGDFDVVVAAYHDQGLAAVKTLEFDTAVNLTLGLPFLRASPDHGTAFDIAGKGVADVGSFAAAVSLLRELTA